MDLVLALVWLIIQQPNMSGDYFYKLPPQPPVTGYEYDNSNKLEAVGYFALANPETMLTVPEANRELVTKLINIDHTDVILEYDLDQVVDGKLGTPAIFKTLGYPSAFDTTLDTMWAISGLTPHSLPQLPAGTRYTHIGCFINRSNSGLRLNVSGGGHYVKQFILEHGGDARWFDRFEHYHANYIATCDFIDGTIHNIRLEIHHDITGNLVTELENDEWAQKVLAHCKESIQKNYSNNLPEVIISHFKVGANTQDIAMGYMKMYTQAQWAN
jgi:hypothetical protein